MANDNLAVFWIQVCKLDGLLGNEAVAGSVEAVTTDAVLFIVLIWNCIQICLSWHALSKCGIEYCYLRYARHSGLTCLNTDQVCRIVQRSEVEALSDDSLNILIYNDRIAVYLSSVQNTMSYCGNLLDIINYTVILVGQCVQNHLNCDLMILHWRLYYIIFLSSRLMSQLRTINTDSLAKSLCQYLLCLRINQLILQRRTAAVNN